MDLQEKTVIVTGSGRGIGKATALMLAKEGCKVVLVSRTEEELIETKKEIVNSDGDALLIVADLAKRKDIEKVIQKTLNEYGNIDILINNAAILYSCPFDEITEKQWDTTMDINLKAVFLISQKVLKIMKEQKHGYIINISSTATLTVPSSIAAYGISKLGIVGLTHAMHEIGKKYGIKVSVIYPGMTDTKMLHDANKSISPEKLMMPEDIADCILFLLKQSDRIIIKELTPWSARHDQI